MLPVEHSTYLWAGSSWLDKCWTYKAPPNAGDKVALQSGGSQSAGLQGRGECPQLVQRSALSSKGFIAFVRFWMKACAIPRGICTAGWKVGPGVPFGRGNGKTRLLKISAVASAEESGQRVV